MDPIVVSSPLRGEYVAVTSPGDKVPSHGTDEWGMTYAFDFIAVTSGQDGAITWHKKSSLDYLLGRIKLADTFGWGAPIYSPVDGIVREAFDSVKERKRLHFLSDNGLILLNGLFFSYKRGKIQSLCGNYLIIDGADCYALLAHLKTGSIKPQVGDAVRAGEVIAELGHSGNSSAPHLHFQLMDRVDLKSAKGLPCCFDTYEINRNGKWESVQNAIPSKTEVVRFTGS